MATQSGRNYKYLVGIDATLDIALEEYGLAWFDDPDKDEIEFFYGVGHGENGDYVRFDNGWLKRDVDPKKEWNWIDDWGGVASYAGLTVDEFLEQPLHHMVSSLLSYYGYNNIFGDCNWGAWYWNKNLQRFQTADPQEVMEENIRIRQCNAKKYRIPC